MQLAQVGSKKPIKFLYILLLKEQDTAVILTCSMEELTPAAVKHYNWSVLPLLIHLTLTSSTV